MNVASPGSSERPGDIDLPALALLLGGWLALYLPTYFWLGSTIWRSDEQGHGPIILLVSAYLILRKRAAFARIANSASPVGGGLVLVFGLLMYVLGRSQALYVADVGSQLVVLAGIVLIFKGTKGLRLILFPIFFLAFMVPLPSALVASVTAPLKLAVSSAASTILYWAGFPVARSGVTLSIGQYQLLVADACAGLNSMFTLEALGLLYLNVMNYTSLRRNVWLAISVIPISFCANVIRVLVLILVTYYFGDEAGQGFVHGFAGMLLFLVALTLILSVDRAIGLAMKGGRNARVASVC